MIHSDALGRPVWDRLLIASAYLYLAVPILIFCFGWLMPLLALISAGLILGAVYLAVRDFGPLRDLPLFSPGFLGIAFLIVFVWVVLSGVGGFAYQNEDLHFKNAILRDLIDHRWPVMYDYSSDAVMRQMFGKTGALVYYLAYWLPAALVGKLLGWHAANLALVAWTLAGVFLAILLMMRYMGRARLAVLIAFVFWGGLDYIGILILRFSTYVANATIGNVFSLRKFVGAHLGEALSATNMGNFPELRNLWLSYPNFTYEFFWSYNQVVPAWLVTLLILNLRQRKHILLAYLLLPLFAPLPAVGLLPFVVYRLMERPAGGSGWALPALRVPGREWLRDGTLLVSVLAAIVLAFIPLAFFASRAGSWPSGFIWNMLPMSWGLVLALLLYYVLKVLAFGLLTFNKREGLALLLIALGWLAVVPVYIFGVSNDFGLRACIPALLVLFTVGFKNIYAKLEQGGKGFSVQATRIAFVIVLMIGSMGPVHEILRSREAILAFDGFPPMADVVGSLGYARAENVNGYVPAEGDWTDFARYKLHYISNFVTGQPHDRWFFRVLAPKPSVPGEKDLSTVPESP